MSTLYQVFCFAQALEFSTFPEFFGLLGYYTVSGGLKPMFWDYLSVSSSRVKLVDYHPLELLAIGGTCIPSCAQRLEVCGVPSDVHR
jgi:hypothetical protein